MTDLQKAEYDLLQIFIDICNKLQLPYFLVCGSALGAVKYSGFIPWDDDIDVAMKREDYQVFCARAQEMLPPNIFLQNYQTDPGFPQIYSKLRNSNTTYIEQSARHLPINHGIYIDIFPLDGYPEGKMAQGLFEGKKRIFESMLLSAYDIPRSGKSAFLYWIYRLLGVPRHTAGIVKRYERMISRYGVQHSDVFANHGNWQGKLEYAPAAQYGSGVMTTFEGLAVRVPEQYDAYLTQKYGAWREELPAEEQVGHHTYLVCDPLAPYTEYQS